MTIYKVKLIATTMDKHERLTLAAGIRASGRGRLCDGYDGGELMSPFDFSRTVVAAGTIGIIGRGCSGSSVVDQ